MNEPELTACDKHEHPLLMVYGPAEEQPCEHLAEMVRKIAPTPSPALRAALGEFLATLDPPGDFRWSYAVPVTDSKGRIWALTAYPPSWVVAVAAQAEGK